MAILNAMTPEELQRSSLSRFTFKDRLLIAEAAKTTPDTVAQLFLEFDTLKTDRTWYFRRIELGPSNVIYATLYFFFSCKMLSRSQFSIRTTITRQLPRA